jgi:hypothetical protein
MLGERITVLGIIAVIQATTLGVNKQSGISRTSANKRKNSCIIPIRLNVDLNKS